MTLHISWGPKLQPAVRYFIDVPQQDWRADYKRLWIDQSPHRLASCDKCRRRRRMKNLLVSVSAWYDPTWVCVQCPPKKRKAKR